MNSMSTLVFARVSAAAIPANSSRTSPISPSSEFVRRTVLSPANRLDRAMGQIERQQDDAGEVGEVFGVDDAAYHFGKVFGERQVLEHRAHGRSRGLGWPRDHVEEEQGNQAAYGGDD